MQNLEPVPQKLAELLHLSVEQDEVEEKNDLK